MGYYEAIFLLCSNSRCVLWISNPRNEVASKKSDYLLLLVLLTLFTWVSTTNKCDWSCQAYHQKYASFKEISTFIHKVYWAQRNCSEAFTLNILMWSFVEWFSFITARKRSCGKVMFLQVSVILSTGGVCIPACTWATLYKQLHSWCVSVGEEAAYR